MSDIFVSNFLPCDKGILRATFDVTIPSWGSFTISKMAYFEKDGKRWIGFPNHKIEFNGDTKWVPLMKFEKSELMKKFCEFTLEAIDRYHNSS